MQFVVSTSSCKERKISALSLTQSYKENNRLLSCCCTIQCAEEEQSGKYLTCDSLMITNTVLFRGAVLSLSSSFFGLNIMSSAITHLSPLLYLVLSLQHQSIFFNQLQLIPSPIISKICVSCELSNTWIFSFCSEIKL